MRLTGLPLLVVISVCLAAALVCHVIAMATHYWLRSDVTASGGIYGPMGAFLNIGLWVACFSNYRHEHGNPLRNYDGCHGLYSDYFAPIRPWLIPKWLVVCRVLSIIGLVLLVLAVILFLLLVLCSICGLAKCGDDRDGGCERFLRYATPTVCVLAGLFVMMTLTVFADNAFRLQCKEFWLLHGGSVTNDNSLAFSWGFEFVSCLFTFIAAGFVTWLVVLKSREDI